MKMKNMLEKILSISLGSITGMVGTVVLNNVLEVLVMGFLAGVVGWFGGKAARWINKKCNDCLKYFYTKKK
jgi:hypothetical protein